jgi:hypothetical protein
MYRQANARSPKFKKDKSCFECTGFPGVTCMLVFSGIPSSRTLVFRLKERK